MKRERIRDITFVSLCVAILSVVSQLSIPTGAVPITLQVLSVSMIGYFLGVKKGLLTIVVYILIGIVGVPVFSGFQGGIGVVLGYTGGFIRGFIPFVLFCGIKCEHIWARVTLGICGLAICHLLGILQYMCLAELDFLSASLVVSVPYIIKDVILTILGYMMSAILEKRLYGISANKKS